MQQYQASFGRLQPLASLQGQVLNQTSAWWMRHTTHITPNALLAVPDPNVAIMKKCQVLPIEFVVRGFMTGALLMPHAQANVLFEPEQLLTHRMLLGSACLLQNSHHHKTAIDHQCIAFAQFHATVSYISSVENALCAIFTC